jgi:hypothetical protein
MMESRILCFVLRFKGINMKYYIIESHDYNAQFVAGKLRSFTEKLRSEGKTVVNCQYDNAYRVIVFYWDN